jgi:hypothetical protein
VISRTDARFADLRVWVDSNTDGVSSAMELKSLDALGITQLGLATDSNRVVDKGNLVGLTSTYQTADGATHAAADVWFAVQATQPTEAIEASLGTKVSGMAQAIGAFADASPQVAALTAGTLGGLGLAENTAPLAIASLVDAMRQFDVNGRPLDAASLAGTYGPQVTGLGSSQAAQLASGEMRPKTELASPGSFANLAMPK